MNDLLNQAQAGRLNITTIVTSCPDICALAWGSGNPDLSGIGANVSYILQAVLTFLCGPVLCLVYTSKEPDGNSAITYRSIFQHYTTAS